MEDAGLQIGLLNIVLWITAVILVITKIYGPPWKWGKKKNNPGSVIARADQTPGLANICRENEKKLVRICQQIAELTKDLEKYDLEHDRRYEKLEKKIDDNNSMIWTRLNQLRDKIQ